MSAAIVQQNVRTMCSRFLARRTLGRLQAENPRRQSAMRKMAGTSGAVLCNSSGSSPLCVQCRSLLGGKLCGNESLPAIELKLEKFGRGSANGASEAIRTNKLCNGPGKETI